MLEILLLGSLTYPTQLSTSDLSEVLSFCVRVYNKAEKLITSDEGNKITKVPVVDETSFVMCGT